MGRAPGRWIAVGPAALVTLASACLLHLATLRHTGGTISFPIDDAYIHLALAKQIAQHGVYGVTRFGFTAASSSIAWPWMLALSTRLFGDHPAAALLLNLPFALAVPFATDFAVRAVAPGASPVRRMLVCLAVVLLAPVPLLVLLGMEHTAHVLFTIVLLGTAVRALARDAPLRPLLLACLGATLFRYESLFLVALVAAPFALRRRPQAALSIVAAGAIPPLAFAVYSLAHGGLALPTSVVLKSRLHLSALVDGAFFHRLVHEPHLTACLVATSGGAYFARSPAARLPLLLTALATLVHLQFGGVGWFYRYDAYLVAASVAFIGAAGAAGGAGAAATRDVARSTWALLLLFVLAAPLAARGFRAFLSTPLAAGNVYAQQVQTARFLAEQFPDGVAAVNDIGAVAYYRDAPIVDLAGLADLEVARAKRFRFDSAMSADDFARLTREAPVAVIYDEWFQGLIPGAWTRVARWTIANNRTCAFPSVSVYATSPAALLRVTTAVRRFAPSLPGDVTTELWPRAE